MDSVASMNPQAVPPPMHDATQALIAECREKGMGNHPFLIKLTQEPVDLGRLYDVLANLKVTTSAYVPWLASVISRVDNDKVRSRLAKILNDELGNGDIDQVHVGLFDRSLEALRPYKPAHFDETLSIGHEFRRRADAIFHAQDALEGVGGVVAGEIFADQFIAWLGGELTRQKVVSPEKIGWYTAHAELEPQHADDSRLICDLASTSAATAASVRRGAEATIAAQRWFLDQLQARYYPTAS